MTKAANKAQAFSEKYNTWQFFKDIRCLDPLQVWCLPQKSTELTGVPQLAEESLALAAEWQIYLKTAKELKTSNRDPSPFVSKQQNPGADFDILGFWAGMEQLIPTLSSVTLKHLAIPINSVDVER
ncbi:hypothetical protein HPB51_011597 [Rhipicephalus microplus]|uniref:HAT C-terminal dimerisation domain-containing protein n=1 Tax=Rhipicephalus microplus TaxID=6941 RepID=A0A9J6E9J3_RHIMP|nr:hypothetical protein HPB51_011597 [Rhipicephalus microplus]